ncbi:ChbG/HpnK family deacetylase [Mucilaginibacter achroorhodeus]|uniref:ChbG/HpnK family deacetylase n=1 Tax=Mucilaginibacter achroorhodeus TaxID=2599294 RepID=A0A563U773_9SPHI|nr:ChbG/HpnK family deacetylase [Mucilaginibacter achroorhodeus]TWR27163.1 ChbG/HpnK family deacetylase [Mucilaginibacter achroorhodeus]
MRKTICLLGLAVLLITGNLSAQQKLPKLMLRLDDIGMCHAVNMAMQKMADTKMPFSASVQFACPWYQEAVAILKKNPQISVGVHLTLTSEWRYYRWGPVTGREAVPSLVDKDGYFHQSTDAFAKSGYKLDDVEKELSAQIERAQASGLKITYIDPHMGIALSTPELRALTEKLAHKYKLAISTLSDVVYFGETYHEMWGEPVATKKSAFLNYVSTKLSAARPNLVVIHVGLMQPEMNALFDMNSNMMNGKDGKPLTSLHRQTELNMMLSPEFKALVNKKFVLTNYTELVKEKGLAGMKKETVKN